MSTEEAPTPRAGGYTGNPLHAPPGGLRRVTLHALTDAGWIAGSIHLPKDVRLMDYIHRAPAFLALTDVFMEAHANALPFLALRQKAIVLMGFDEQVDLSPPDETSLLEEHKVSCLFTLGRLQGVIELRPGLRLSDALGRYKDFLPLTNCVYELRKAPEAAPTKGSRPFMLINCDKIIGLLERSSPGR